MALHCLSKTALEETEYIALHDFAKSLRELKIFSSKKAFLRFFISFVSFLKVLENRIRLRVIFYYLQPKNLIFDQIETKLASEMEEEKPFIFAGFGLPTRSCLFCFHMMTFS